MSMSMHVGTDDYRPPLAIRSSRGDMRGIILAGYGGAFLASMTAQHRERGQIVFDQDNPENVFAIVTSGLVKLVAPLADGREQIVALLFASDCVWHRTSSHHSFRAEAASESDILLLSGKRVESRFAENPALCKAVLARARSDVEHARARLLVLGRMTAIEKVASLLMELQEKMDSEALPPITIRSNHPVVVLALSRLEMGDYLGLSEETVSRCFAAFKREGLIKLQNARTVEICDPDGIAAIADCRFSVNIYGSSKAVSSAVGDRNYLSSVA